MKFQIAMGKVEGDYLILQNKWANILLTYSPAYSPEKPYAISGDCYMERFKHFGDALNRAVDILGEFQKGRSD